ncbi:hypothetical protein F4819DRAFT_461626 [Hypoxylon fuscum]|nr:hypothetical protein F4819DRAFT_461626 [Hypoxylon fuscum]
MDWGSSKKAAPKDSKGKGVERNKSPSSPTQDNDPPASSDTTSVISRLSASASKLVSSTIPQQASNVYIAGALPSSKAESSRADRGTGASEASIYRNSPAQASVGDTFKSRGAPEQRSTHGESDFSTFLDSTSMLGLAQPENLKFGGYEQSYDPGIPSRQTAQTTAVAKTDGMEVVNLLDSGYDQVEETPTFLTDDERVALRYQLFEYDEAWRGSPQRRQWEDGLNFFPDSGSNDNGIREYADLLGTSDLGEARGIWIDQWQYVLSSYTEEVWGDLSPLVREARDELSHSERSKDASPSKLKALRRLQQILTHVRGI